MHIGITFHEVYGRLTHADTIFKLLQMFRIGMVASFLLAVCQCRFAHLNTDLTFF